MYSIVLVEDEGTVRDGIVKKIDWAKHGFTLAGAFENGKLAADALLNNPVDVVITDVNMPVMDGLSLARFLSENMPRTIVVILTGFGDFSYAQTAIRYKVHEYILKPITAKQLRELLNKLKSELERRCRDDDDVELIKLRRDILNLIKAGEAEPVFECLEHFLRLLENQGEWARHIQKLALLVLDYIGEKKLDALPLEFEGDRVLEQLRLSQTLEDAGEFVRSYVTAVLESISGRTGEAGRQAIQAVEFIKQNYSDPGLSLQKITSYLSVSTSHFSNLFKHHTGVTFVDFITRLRIHKAQDLLISTDLKNYEIADRVGYDDSGYFSSIFKKFTGMKPSEYRREYKRNGGAPPEK